MEPSRPEVIFHRGISTWLHGHNWDICDIVSDRNWREDIIWTHSGLCVRHSSMRSRQGYHVNSRCVWITCISSYIPTVITVIVTIHPRMLWYDMLLYCTYKWQSREFLVHDWVLYVYHIDFGSPSFVHRSVIYSVCNSRCFSSDNFWKNYHTNDTWHGSGIWIIVIQLYININIYIHIYYIYTLCDKDAAWENVIISSPN